MAQNAKISVAKPYFGES